MADWTKIQLIGLKMLTPSRIYPQCDLQIEFLALSIPVKSMETQRKMESNKRKMPPSSATGRNTADIFVQNLTSLLFPSAPASAASRSRRTRVRSSRIKVSSSRRSLEERPLGFPSFRPSSWRCLSRLLSNSEAVVADRAGTDIEGADLMRDIGNNARPAAV